jgi:hypothetical protein
MLKLDIDLFTKKETTELDDSFNASGLSSRASQAITGAFLSIGVALALFYLDVPRVALTATLVLYAVVFTAEKLSYVRSLVTSRSVVRKLVRRIETLEGLSQTPDNAQPSRRTSLVAPA